ncbi:receptor-like protein kinase FERONIA [Tanacetum coccineum]|uniref:Receptor-like protein kinase FERONIA n=1 Tax=Tanacetum coccineum TaxID=301880 RepID=A0ABQ5FF45_9ASTR
MDKANGEAENLTSSTSAQPSRRFTIADIQSATNNFDDELVIGQGGFGKVYKGQISIEDSSHFVAIKRLDSISNQGAAEFKAEIEMLSKLRHYRKTLVWIQRLKIAIGAGRGLDYLHAGFGTQRGVIHRDVKSSNILLDENWAAMISDFGLSKIGPIDQASNNISVSVKGTFGRKLCWITLFEEQGSQAVWAHKIFGTQNGVIHRDVKSSNILLDENLAAMISDFGLSKIGPIDQTAYNVSVSVKGTFGYLDPEYFYTSKLTRKTGMYAFGVVLFELLSGKLAVDTRLEEQGTFAPKVLRGFAEIANRCLIRDFEKRPSMTQVVAKLQDFLELQEKCDNSTDSPGTSGFTWMIRKYRASATNQNSGTIRLLPLATKVKIAVGIARGIVYLCNTTDNVGKLASYFSQDSELYEWDKSICAFELDKYKILLNEVLLVLFSCSHSKLERQ